MLSSKFMLTKYLLASKSPHHLQLQNFPFPCPTRYKSEFDNKCKRKYIRTNTPHPPRDPPENYNPPSFTHCAFDKPTNIQPLVFRPMQGFEILGPNASKKKVYKNPEYFAYHRFSHVDLFMNAMRIRMEKRMQQMCPKSQLAPECQEDEDSDEDCEEKVEQDNCEKRSDTNCHCTTNGKGK